MRIFNLQKGARLGPSKNPFHLLTVLILSLIVLAATLYSASVILMKGISQLEYNDTVQNTLRVRDALNNELQRLNSVAADYAMWDESYGFVKNKNREFIETNLTDETFSRLNINMLVFITNAGAKLFAKEFNLKSGAPVDTVNHAQQFLDKKFAIREPGKASCITGVSIHENMPLLIACRPVTKSSGEGPVSGTLIIGRCMDAHYLSKLMELTHVKIEIINPQSSDIPPAFPAGTHDPELQGTVQVQIQSSDIICGYLWLKDIDGGPVVLVKVLLPREIFRLGITSRYYLFSMVLSAVCIYSILLYLFFRKLRLSERKQESMEERFRIISESSPDAIILANDKGEIIYWSAGAEKMFGYTAVEALGQPRFIILPDRFHESDQQYFQKYATAGDVPFGGKVVDFNCKRKDGTEFPAEGSFAVARHEKESFFSVILRNVSERKKAENEALHAKEFMENVFKTSGEGLLVTDAQGYFVKVNARALKIFGYTEHQILGRHMAELSPHPYSLDFNNMPSVINQLFKDGFVENYETEYKRNDGSAFAAETNIRTMRDTEGNLIGAVSSVRDITERKKAEKTLRESGDFFEAVIEGSRDGIVICDQQGMIIRVNQSVEQMFGFNREYFVGKHASCLVVEDKEVRDKVLMATGRLFEQGYTTYETMHRTKDRGNVTVECIASMIKDEQGNYSAGVAVLRDVTERKRQEEQNRQSQKMQAIGTLAGGIAHDFNNILAAIIGYTELAYIKTPPDSEPAKYLDGVLKAADRAKNLVKQILSFSRKDELERKPVQLHHIVKEALKLLRSSIPTTIEFSQSITESNDVVIAEPTQIHQVIMNLCTNAAQAMQAEGGVLEIRLAHLKLNEADTKAYDAINPGHYVRLTVSDTGPGIDPHIIDRIFEPFFTTKEVGKGTGMGLSVVHGIVKSHGGAITVYSEPGRGTMFTVLLPCSEAA